MRVLVYGIAAAALAATQSLAADPQGPGSASYPWSGLYFGGHVGFGKVVSTEDFDPNHNPNIVPRDPQWTFGAEGSAGGAFLGYNHLISDNALVGVEVEGNLSSMTSLIRPSAFGDHFRHPWSIAARSRLGFLPTPNTLLYASLGLAAGRFDYGDGYWSQWSWTTDLDYTGHGIQLGVGGEVFVTPDLSVRLEAVYTRYATHSIYDSVLQKPFVDVEQDTLIGRVGVAWHPGWHGAPARGPAVAPSPANWDGFYVGAHAGLAVLDSIENFHPDYSQNFHPDYSQYVSPEDPYYWDFGGKAGTIGIHAGYNRQFGTMVAGLEIEGNLLRVAGDYEGIFYDGEYVTHTNPLAVRARLGFLAMQNTLLYGSLGLTHGSFQYSKAYWGDHRLGTDFAAHGVQIGAGIEAFVSDRISGRIEALYANYGDHDFTEANGSGVWVVNPRTFTARAGLTLHLN